MTGIAKQENLLNINDKVSDYLGSGWTSLTHEKENLITNKHLLTMASGINDVENEDCITPDCLTYKADAGTHWAYRNVYVKLQDVIEQTFNSSFNSKLRDNTGMSGNWVCIENNSVYSSTTRSMACFWFITTKQRMGKRSNFK